MKRVTGLGGIFFKCQDPEKMKKWYQEHLGIASGEYGSVFKWRDQDSPDKECVTAWNLFPATTTYLDPSQKPFMINYRVDDLKALLEALRNEGVTVVGEIQEFDYGKFGWILDPEGNKIELWEAID